ncbi:hypothetical protein GCK72_012892 [Caenorhabditis remanei]|uniref:Domain of unknown function DB domain-containing protein n=1 Tax=Caenorhabditis remanei TaxID=31234 RepID=A0A6A5GPN8_CAERE|nr:hypothetical protein GCK72_012892 [Caenorhabditis remanei]KAF1756439.1 hypothetical protein GCK72_012892 [Caenorhabditis remanei]
MREKHLLQLLLLFLLSTEGSTQLSCHRIPTSFCCTTRIRDQCPEQCATVQCGTEFIHNLFSTDGSRKPASVSGAHDGNANIGGTGSGDSQRGFGGSNSGDARVGGASRSSFETITPPPEVSTTTLPTTSSGFPTLIPFSSESWSTITQAPLAPSLESRPELPPIPSRIPSPTGQNSGCFLCFQSHRRRTTPDPRIIRPPESLVVIGDYDEDEPPSENAVVDSPQPLAPSQPSFFSQTPPPTPPAPSVISNSGDVFARSRKEISATPDFEQQSGTAATLSGSSHEWKVSIIPRGQNNKPTGVNSIPPFTIDGKADERFNKFYRTIDSVINKLDLTNSGDQNGREKEPQIRLEGNTKDLSVESSAVVIVPRTTVAPDVTNKVSVIPFRPLHFTAPPKNGPPTVSPPPAPGGQCGVAPDFTPCVSNEIASKSLLECSMDRGQCGIFNVAPFLECASQGKDNSECCRHRRIVQKTGPQCEQFCRPTQGLSALGVQHIVCGNAVGDMLHCHHSGVRI